MSEAGLDVLYETEGTSLARRVVVSVGVGAAFWAMMVFLRWGLHPGGDLRGIWAPRIVGAAITLTMLVGAFRSRMVRRVALDTAARTLRLDRDPGAVDTIALADVQSVASEARAGGWSTNPSERLVLTLRDGRVLRYTLPDDADTPGIVKDIMAVQAPRAPQAS